MINFKERNPEFFKKESFWPVTDEEMKDLAGKFGFDCWEFGSSAGNRPMLAMALGDKEEMIQRTTYSGALQAKHLEDYLRPREQKQVIMVVSTVHGVEVEGCAVLGNLMSISATGVDLKGKAWPILHELIKYFRLVLVPIGNPDGRVRSKIRNLKGGTAMDLYFYGQGVKKDGSILTWPDCKRDHPIVLDQMEYLGGYYNDKGENIMTDDIFAGGGSAELASVFNLVRAERPDYFLNFHSCGAGPFFTSPYVGMPPAYLHRYSQIASVVAQRLHKEGLRPNEIKTDESAAFTLIPAVQALSGAMSMLFEFPHGLNSKPYELEEIVDIGLYLFEEILMFGSRFHFRP
jgi:hypothetical protein